MKDKSKFTGNELKYLEKVVNGETWSSTEGSWVNEYEKSFASRFGAKFGIAANSGTITLQASLNALGIGLGDEVITTALSVIMDSSAIILCGATPIYADIVPETFNIDPKSVRKKISSKTKAILAVSLYGLPIDEELLKIAKDYNLFLIEDNAQSMSQHRALISSYSTENSKFISTLGEGGMVLTNEPELARKIRLFLNHGFKNSSSDSGQTKLNQDLFQHPNYLRHSIVGTNGRLTEAQGAVGLAQLEHLDEILEKRKIIAKMFRETFDNYENGWFKVQKDDPKHTYWTFATEFNGNLKQWENFRKEFMNNGGNGIYASWAVAYFEPAIIKVLGDLGGTCPLAEKIQSNIMQFKINHRDLEVAKKQVEALEKTLKERKWI